MSHIEVRKCPCHHKIWYNHRYSMGVGNGGGEGGGDQTTPLLGANFIRFLYKVLGQISANRTLLKINI